jgi:DnaD/phage-associated family protein
MPNKVFEGFPEKTEVTPIPTLFLSSLMPRIDDIAELKTILHIFRLLSRRRGYPRFITLTELSADSLLKEGIAGNSIESFGTVLQNALDLAVQHRILLHLKFNKNNRNEDIYFINTEGEKKVVEKIERGELVLSGLTPVKSVVSQSTKIPDIFSLYEQNIGILTPIVGEQLQEAEGLYPTDWIESAFKEAVSLNRRNWKYIARILERWATEGKDDGKIGRDIKKEKDPDRYIKGKYGHMVRR